MERKVYCEGARCAKLTITIGNKAPLIFIAKKPPLIFEGNIKIGEEFSTKGPITKFDYEAQENFVAARLIAEAPGTAGRCPVDAQYQKEWTPDWDSMYGSEFRGQITYLGKIVHGELKPGPYPSFGPGCDYRLYRSAEKKALINFFEEGGKTIYSEIRNDSNLKYEVECDACCSEDEFLLESSSYPGYKCVPINPISNRIATMQQEVRRTQ